MNNYFLENWQFNYATPSPTHMASLKDYLHNLTKHEREIQKSQFSDYLVNWEEC